MGEIRIRTTEEIAREAAEEVVKAALAAGAQFKAEVRVRPYMRDGHPVVGYTRSWHLTDNPKFAFDPDRVGIINSTIGGEMDEPGLFITKDPEFWVNRHNYIRPFVAEIEHPADVEHGYYQNSDQYLPARLYPESRIVRVIPTDEYVREEFHQPGWIEEFHGDVPEKFKLPIREGDLGMQRYEIPEDYHYEGPDVRDMPTAEVKRHMDRAAAYIEQSERRFSMLHKIDPATGEYMYDSNGDPVFDKWQWNYTPSGKRRKLEEDPFA